VPTLVVTVLLALVAVALQRAPELQLKLGAGHPLPERPFGVAIDSGAEDCINVTGLSDPGPRPLKVTLADTDRLSYTVGDAMSFSVVLENVGGVPMVLGISPDPDVAPRRECRVVAPGARLRIALYAMNRRNQPDPRLTATLEFYGSPGAPATTAVLQPGERARVKLPALITRSAGMDPALTADPQPVRIKAFVSVERESGTTVALSENTLQIELRASVARLPSGAPPR
jgi:hypothetical protein